ncbi:MAG: Imm26 family immunity protein [Pseudomonadota bacterium]
MATQKTNFRVLKRTRRRPEAGDIFAFQLEPLPDNYHFGRVVATDTTLGNCDAVVLIYIYRATSTNKATIPVLSPSDLLVPPIGTNNLAWTRGYFEVVASVTNGPDDLLQQHCFLDPVHGFVDAYGRRLPTAFEPVGFYGLSGLGSIDIKVSEALGLPPGGQRIET